MAIEDCDWPLYRQMVAASLARNFFKKGVIDCSQHQFVLDIGLVFRCHGRCDHQDPLFADYYKTHLRRRNLSRGKKVENKAAHSDSAISQNYMTSFRSLKQSEKKNKDEDKTYYDYKASSLMGLCSTESIHTPKSPSLERWEANANLYKNAKITLVDIRLGEGHLCRCEYPGENLYTKYHPFDYSEYAMVNGILIVPSYKCKNLGGRRHLVDNKAELFDCY